MQNFGPANTTLIVFGIPITEFGDTDPPFTIEDIDARSTLKRGIGATSLRLDAQTRPKRLTINLMPGSIQGRQLIAAEKSGADCTFVYQQTGTNERVAGFDGVMTQRGSMGRGGKTTVTDDQFVFEFNDSEET